MIVVCGLLQAMETQLKETQKLADMYREQVIDLEDKLARIREEGDIGKELFKVSVVVLLHATATYFDTLATCLNILETHPSEWMLDTREMSVDVANRQSQSTYQHTGGAVTCAESAYYVIILNFV